jgi:glycerol-3-phosphate dehydrogenase (NAD(P)+)
MSVPHIAVIGGGAWGIALAAQSARAGAAVTLWMRSPPPPGTRRLPRLPDIEIPPGITITHEVPRSADLALLAVPMQTLRDISNRLEIDAPLIACCKGIERETGRLPLDILAETRPGHDRGMLSGPNFAIEVAQGLPAAAVLAAADLTTARTMAALVGTATFRVYASDDPAGVQLAGAAKNVIAIGAGVAIGAGLGENARAALITRAVAEIGRLSEAMGGRATTVAGLAGLGDLILTCTGRGSRNYSLGLALGAGERLADILASRSTVAEGVATAPALLALARRHHVAMPIVETTARLLSGEFDVSRARDLLLDRPPAVE